jgi:FKBP-type peptidyl-prolyl cis-trans isomerase
MRLSVRSLLLSGFLAAMLLGCSARSGLIVTSSGLGIRVLSPGSGPVAAAGQSVTIHEITTLTNGTVIFSSRERNTPITFLLGGNQVISGVDEGVTGMRVGERRLLIVPPSLSHRSSYPPNTPPDSILHIEVELVGVQ